jgi:hypothetical protein
MQTAVNDKPQLMSHDNKLVRTLFKAFEDNSQVFILSSYLKVKNMTRYLEPYTKTKESVIFTLHNVETGCDHFFTIEQKVKIKKLSPLEKLSALAYNKQSFKFFGETVSIEKIVQEGYQHVSKTTFRLTNGSVIVINQPH